MANVLYSSGVSPHTSTRDDPSGALSYPSPFFDVAGTYLPNTTKELFKYCRYYTLTNPLVSAVVYKMALYPVTDVIFSADEDGLKKKWESLLHDSLRIKSFLVEANLDRECYGNTYVSVYFPFRKWLICRHCGHESQAAKTKFRMVNHHFRVTCEKCDTTDDAKVKDRAVQDVSGIRLIRWDPESVTVDYNPITQERRYYYTIPRRLKNAITVGTHHVVSRCPQAFIDAIRKQRAVVLESDNLYHYRRASISHMDSGLGVPRLLPVLKDVWQMAVLRKSQEAVAMGHIVPLRVLFPQPGSGTSDPYTNVNIVNWEESVKSEIAAWRKDPNYFAVMPLPVGFQNIGGDARSLAMSDETKVWSQHIVAGMGAPQEFIFGGLSYSGSSVSMRMLENEFLRTREDMFGLIRFIVKRVGLFMGWREATATMAPFKMADDLQRAAFDFQLAMAGKISDKTLLESRDYNQRSEQETLREEAKDRAAFIKETQRAQAEAAGEAMLIQTKFGLRAQELQAGAQMDQQGQMGMGGQPGMEGSPAPEGPAGAGQSQIGLNNVQGGGGVDLGAQAQNLVAYMGKLDPATQQQEMTRLSQENPPLHQLVASMLQTRPPAQPQMPGMGQTPLGGGQPLPTQRPPQRGPSQALV